MTLGPRCEFIIMAHRCSIVLPRTQARHPSVIPGYPDDQPATNTRIARSDDHAPDMQKGRDVSKRLASA